MERYNPFEKTEENVYGGMPLDRQLSSASNQRSSGVDAVISNRDSGSPVRSRYTTSFPDPFGELKPQDSSYTDTTSRHGTTELSPGRSNSVTFSRTFDDADPTTAIRGTAGGRQQGGLTTFITRATSVTSSTVTDRMNEAVGSVKSAVDSLSNQIQQVVPGGSLGISQTSSSKLGAQQQQQQQQTTASYLASKFSSASQFGSASIQSQSSNPLPVISRQRVLLVLEDPESLQWSQQFINYRKFAAASSGQQSSITSFISSATAQITSTAATSLGLGAGSGGSNKADSADLVEQADFRQVSVLSNQASSIATVLVTSNPRTLFNVPLKATQKIVRPEFVVVRQNAMADNQLKDLVQGLDHCMVPMLEPIDIWNVFQGRYQVFSRLLRVQKRLGKENFPLIPQIYCQTSLDLSNYLQSSSTIAMPCLVRPVSTAKSKIKVESTNVLKSLATLMGTTNNTGCTLEPYLEVKCDLIVQKIGNSLKLFKRTENRVPINETLSSSSASSMTGYFNPQTEISSIPTNRSDGGKQSLLRQSSLGGSMLSSFIGSTTTSSLPAANKQQLPGAGPASFEKMAEVTNRYKNWMEAVASEFDNKLEAFCLKIIITTNDREYVVGMDDCSMAFLGNPDNQDEDRRHFVELIINTMNTALSDRTNLSRELSSGTGPAPAASADTYGDAGRLLIREERSLPFTPSTGGLTSSNPNQGQSYLMSDKRKFTSQTQINGFSDESARPIEAPLRSYGALSSRSQSVSMNQSDYCADATRGSSLMHHKGSLFMDRRGSDQLSSEDFTLSGIEPEEQSVSSRMSQHQRQASLGQSFLDQTSTAFSSFQKQSWSFFKRLDSRAGDGPPPLSAKSEQNFNQQTNNFSQQQPDNNLRSYESGRGQAPDYKSQSIDNASMEVGEATGRCKPPKPPPPRSMQTMQDSSSSGDYRHLQTPHSTPVQTRQNSMVRSGGDFNHHRPYEPYDPELAQMLRSDLHQHHNQSDNEHLGSVAAGGSMESITQLRGRSIEGVKRNLEAMKRADSTSTTNSETTSTEDTMNNLKKTFASIFGDKCE